MDYCICNIKKNKRQAVGKLQHEANRTAVHYKNQVDQNRLKDNVYLIRSDNWLEDINRKLQEEHIKPRKDAIVCLTGIYTASNDWFKDNPDRDYQLMYFEQCIKWHEKHYGQVISAVVHYDEHTPHLHISSIPITDDGRLSAKELVGNKGQMHYMQTDFWQKVGFQFGMDRGKERSSNARKKHLEELEYRAETLSAELSAKEECLVNLQQDISQSFKTYNNIDSRLKDADYTKRLEEKIDDLEYALGIDQER